VSAFTYTYYMDDPKNDDVVLELVCDMEFEPPWRGARVDGVQMEPDYDAQAVLCSAMCGDEDMLPKLTQRQTAEIEAAALEEHLQYLKDERESAQELRAQEIYEARWQA
jgi:hypothetical protein